MKLNNKIFNGIKACIFDLDGTLIDSLYVWNDVDVKFFKMHNMPVPENYVKEIAHMSFMEMAIFTHDKYGFKETPEEIAKIWMDMVEYEYANEIVLRPHVEEVLKLLKENNIKIALATTNKKELYEPCLKHNNIEGYFDIALNVNDYGTSKRESKIYEMIADKFGVKKSETIVFEDILMAIKTAKEAGFKVIGIEETSSLKDKEKILQYVDLYINDFKLLME